MNNITRFKFILVFLALSILIVGDISNWYDHPNQGERSNELEPHLSSKLSSTYVAARYVTFRFYSQSRISGVEFNFDEIQFLSACDGFKMTVWTIILIHGWRGSAKSAVCEPLALEYLGLGEYNVLTVDWEDGARNWFYPLVRYRVPEVADLVAALIEYLLDIGQAPDQIGMVGHSLGAHVAGLAGKRTKQKVAFIMGLDPAAFLFHFSKHTERLSINDAQYVEVTHTTGYYVGFYENIGHADFYVNGGKWQPGCGVSIHCSHERAVLYFKESLRGRNHFSYQCPDLDTLGRECLMDWAMLGGGELKLANEKPRGIYYVGTAKTEPFLRLSIAPVNEKSVHLALPNKQRSIFKNKMIKHKFAFKRIRHLNVIPENKENKFYCDE